MVVDPDTHIILNPHLLKIREAIKMTILAVGN